MIYLGSGGTTRIHGKGWCGVRNCNQQHGSQVSRLMRPENVILFYVKKRFTDTTSAHRGEWGVCRGAQRQAAVTYPYAMHISIVSQSEG